MRYYGRLLWIFYKSALINELEYRLNFWSNLLLSSFWLTWAILGVRVYFFHTQTIAGWTYHELLVVIGLFYIMNGVKQMILTPNLSRMPEYVRMGTLDYVLTKPINSQFLVSLRYIGVYNWGDPLIGLGLVLAALWRMDYVPPVYNLAMFSLLMLSGMILLYSVMLILQTTTFWLTTTESVDDLVMGLLETGRVPVTFYNRPIQIVLSTLVPVAFLTTFPAEMLLNRENKWVVWVSVGIAALLFLIATSFWKFALRYYTSVSS